MSVHDVNLARPPSSSSFVRWPLSKPSLMADTNDAFDQKPGNKYWVDVQVGARLRGGRGAACPGAREPGGRSERRLCTRLCAITWWLGSPDAP